ncbi:hypothetical protein DFJ63DRAFT_229301 [Scheffersomyces coipomensis]|uniref:uncharacterized protein n=1 Tax=Scheffersomyces coipomensis TaxID=1788519 RepID=UPI00315D63B1
MKAVLFTILATASLALADDTITQAPSPTTNNPYATYPAVAKTASINGFADRIYDQMPDCAKPCLFEDTGKTPCPYWDTGCLCVMPQFAGSIGECIAQSCKGENVVVATRLATSICSSAGVWSPYWIIPPPVSSDLSVAAAATDAVATNDASEHKRDQVDNQRDAVAKAAPSY